MRRAASTSMHNLQELVNPGPGGTMLDRIAQLEAEEAQGTSVDQSERVVIVCNSLPLKMRHDPEGSEERGHSWHRFGFLRCDFRW